MRVFLQVGGRLTSAAAQRVQPKGDMMRILAVDDDPVILDLLKNTITDIDGYTLTCVDTCEGALDAIRAAEDPFDCLLLDIILPGTSGIELCKKLRRTPFYKSVPILMITASREVGLMDKAFQAGATDFISKPLHPIELKARINSAGLLNQSLLREHEAKRSLNELAHSIKLGFEEPFTLNAEGTSTLLSIENWLLRLDAGCYAMQLFTFQVECARGIHRAISPLAFRQRMEIIADAAIDALSGRRARLAYAGSGRFICIVLGRSRLNSRQVLAEIDATLALTWDDRAAHVPQRPKLVLKELSTQRFWSGNSASHCLRQHIETEDSFAALAGDEDQNIFAKLDNRDQEDVAEGIIPARPDFISETIYKDQRDCR